jgi:hypothetical protein
MQGTALRIGICIHFFVQEGSVDFFASQPETLTRDTRKKNPGTVSH